MVQADASGVLFTVNPVSGMHEEVVINATLGVGEALVAGQITPDTIIVEKTSGRITKREIGKPLLVIAPIGSSMNDGEVETARQRQFVLTDEQVTQLVRFGERVEQYFGVPQDIEWVITGEQIFIVQARPITTLTTISSVPQSQGGLISPGDDTWDRELDTPPQPYDVWTRTNVGENLPYPITPLTETNFPVLFNLNNDPSEPQLTRRLYGRLYFNEGAVFRSFSEEMGLPASWLHKM